MLWMHPCKNACKAQVAGPEVYDACAVVDHCKILLSCQVRVSESGSMAAQLMVSTYYGLLRLLGTCAAGSHSVAEVNAARAGTVEAPNQEAHSRVRKQADQRVIAAFMGR